MADGKTYFELLQNPKWQKKRLEVLQAADFQCENCGADDKPLHVHHTYYEKNRLPWDYPIDSLHSLCEDCHHKAQELATLLKRQLGKISLGDHEALYGYGLGLEAASDHALPIDVFSYEVAMGVGAVWELSAEEVMACLREGTVDGATLNAMRSSKREVLKVKGVRSHLMAPKPPTT